jgi:hypothetical protein
LAVVAAFDHSQFTNTPQALREVPKKEPQMSAEAKPVAQELEPIAAVARLQLGHSTATLAELKEACPGATAEFLMSQLESEATVPQASKAWMAAQQEQIAALKKQAATPKPAEPAPQAKKPGAEPIPVAAGGEQTSDPLAQFEAAVDEQVAKGKPRHVAHAHVCRTQPELRASYVAAYNAAQRPSKA